ncbi:hypothetical protein EEL30_22045 [Brevibacillus laterosporus]|uniref:Uncharacterized protein n=1 Tax=Brevibacillus laterosporus TaxID=1465 RepID=A0A518VCK1_BRELA|nr:hypothetical protein EEL30_22045 [Brevibacillus laterosporus]
MIKQQFEKVVNEVISGERYTLFGFNEFGFPNAQHVVIKEAEVKKYAQYDYALYITFKPKGKRTWYQTVFTPRKTLVIWKGWQNVADEMYATDKIAGIVTQTSYSCFDEKYLYQGLNSVSEEPLVILNEDYYKSIEDFEFIYQVADAKGRRFYNDISDLKKEYEETGILQKTNVRKELRGQPTFKNLLGPMWNGMEGNKHIIRYEG